jgi:hypothetical protein
MVTINFIRVIPSLIRDCPLVLTKTQEETDRLLF